MLDRIIRMSPKVADHGHGRDNPSPIEQVDKNVTWAFLGLRVVAVASSHEPAVELRFVLGIIYRDHTCIAAQLPVKAVTFGRNCPC